MRGTTIGTAVGTAVLCSLLAGCAALPGSGTGGADPVPSDTDASASASAPESAPAPVTASVPVSATASASSGPTSSASSSAGTTAASCGDLTAVPAGSSVVGIGAKDLDGHQDTLFLTASAPWCFGVHTTSRVIALPDPLIGSGVHHVWETGTDGSTGRAIVLDDGAHALVYRWRDGGIQQLRSTAGGPLTFPVGTTSTGGTGVNCNDQNGGVLIEGSTARRNTDGTVDVLWATVSQVNEAGVAMVDAPSVRYRALQASDSRVQKAESSWCFVGSEQAHANH